MPPMPIRFALPFIGALPVDITFMAFFPVAVPGTIFFCVPMMIIMMLAIVVAMVVIIVILRTQIRNWNQ